MFFRSGILAVVLVTLASAATAQEYTPRVPVRAFPFALLPYVALGFRGVRAAQVDSLTCPNSPLDCHQHKVTSGPAIGGGVQLPLFGTFGAWLTFHASWPRRAHCTQGFECGSVGNVTGLQGTALLVFRLKARAPAFFGFGVTGSRWTPGPVHGQADPVTETGGAFVIGYDSFHGQRFGVRVTWSNYFMRPSGGSLPSNYRARNRTHDSLITIGARIGL